MVRRFLGPPYAVDTNPNRQAAPAYYVKVGVASQTVNPNFDDDISMPAYVDVVHLGSSHLGQLAWQHPPSN